MLLYSLGVGALIPLLPKLNPPSTTTRYRLRLSPPYSISITAAATVSVADTIPLDANKDFLAHFLIHSLGFSKDEAISASTKVRPLKPSETPELALQLLRKYGFDETQIKEIVSSSPQILSKNPDLTTKPKINFFLQYTGVSRQDFVKLIKKNPYVLCRGLNTCLIPTYDFLKQVLGDDDKAVQTIRKSPWVFTSPCLLERMQLNVQLLRNYGIADEIIRNFMMRNPRNFTKSPELMQDAASRVDMELGIPRDSPMVLRGICALASVSKPNLQKKYEIFKSFGWTDSDIITMGRKHPYCLNLSEDKIRRALDFFMKELGYKPEYLASHPTFLMYSLEKRVKPRYEVWKIMKENQLEKDKRGMVFYSLVGKSESTFLNSYVLPYKDKLLNLHEFYNNCGKLKLKD